MTTPDIGDPPPFVGRGRLLENLAERVRPGGSPLGRLVLLRGEAGIGKTRTVHELTSRLAGEGATVMKGRTWAHGDAPPHWPWVQAMRSLPGAPRTTHLHELAGCSSQADRFELFDAVAARLAEIAATAPLVVALDDLHDADEGTVLLLQFLAHELDHLPVLLVGAYRIGDAARSGALAAHLEALERIGEVVDLAPLSVDEVGRLIGDEHDATDLHARTGGNPLFVLHLHRRTDQMSAETLSGDVTSAVRSTVAAVDQAIRDVVVAVAMLGPAATRERIAELLDIDLAEAARRIRRAADERLLADAGQDVGLVVAHPVIGEVLVADLADDRRRLLHLGAAEAIGDDIDLSGEHAEHLLAAGPDHESAALDACRTAARQAAFANAYDREAELLEHVLELSERRGDLEASERCELLLDLGRARWHAGRRPEADSAYEAAMAIAAELDDADLLARGALGGGFDSPTSGEGRMARAAQVRRALEAQPGGDSAHRAQLLAQLVPLEDGSEDDASSRDRAEEAFAIARRVGDHTTLGYALVAQQVVELGPATLAARVASSRQIVALGEEAGDGGLILQGHFHVVGALLEEGDLASLDAALVEHARAVDQLGQPAYERHVLWFRAMRLIVAGRAEEAEAVAEAGLEAALAAADPDAFLVYGGQLAVIRWLQGRIREMEPLWGDMRRDEPTNPLWAATLAWLWATTGQLDAARGAVGWFEDLGDLDAIPADRHWLLTTTALAEAVSVVGARELAADLRSRLLPYADRVVPIAAGISWWGTVARPLGLLATALGLHDEAERHLTDAVSRAARMGARPWVAQAQLDLASLLAARPDRSDEVARLLAEAAATVEEVGAKELGTRIDELARLNPTVPDVSQTVPAIAERAVAVPVTDGTAEPEAAGPTRPSVSVLGTFEVVGADGEVARWNSRKARELLKILVSRRGVAVPRERLMELLWPDEDHDRLANRLSVAISTVRRAFAVARSERAADPIVADAETVRLDLDRVTVDVEEFLAAAATALERDRAVDDLTDPDVAALLREAFTAYGGEALADEPYTSWAEALRSEAATAAVLVSRALAGRAEASGDPLTAVGALRRILDADPYDEAAHHGLIRLFTDLDAHGQARAAQDALDAAMRDLTGEMDPPVAM